MPGPGDWAIPARAGRTLLLVLPAMDAQGHPCACRENMSNVRTICWTAGPSLRVQGEHQDASGYMKIKRAIPARAGRTRARSDVARPRMGHPCACRENVLGEWKELPTSGPSLRVQGEPLAHSRDIRRIRAIPARAGRTTIGRSKCQAPVGHPCACRENAALPVTSRGRRGPSLRVQGERYLPRPLPVKQRAIPARAGRTHGSPHAMRL